MPAAGLPAALPGAAGVPPDAIILSGPEFYTPHVTRLYGGYKRTRNLYGRVTYQKDPDQGGPGLWEAYIYWSAVDSRWCVGPQLGAAIGEVYKAPPPAGGSPAAVAGPQQSCAVLIYQASPEDDSASPSLLGSWAANLYGSGARYQVDHMLTFEGLQLPPEAADPARDAGGYMHICTRKFVDYEFPPKVTSIVGDAPPLRTHIANRPYAESATWMRASALAQQDRGPLFDASTEPRGDWLQDLAPERAGLQAVFAAVREFPGHLEMLFASTPEATPEGSYSVWLYDVWQSTWRHITVDEFVPVVRATNGEHEPWGGGHGRTLWSLLLEKAFAKLCGSYEVLRHADPGPMLMALTGEIKGMGQWRQDTGWWSQNTLLIDLDPAVLAPKPVTPAEKIQPGIHRRVQAIRPLRLHVARVGGTWQQGPELFHTMRNLHRGNSLIFAYRDGGVDVVGERRPGYRDPSGSGLVFGLGYSVLGLVEVEVEGEEEEGSSPGARAGTSSLQLVQLRNLWGAEVAWRGAWAEGSAEWERFPEVRRHHLRAEHQATGRFWMAWADFCQIFDRIDVCPMPNAARKSSYVPRQPQSPQHQQQHPRSVAAKGERGTGGGGGGGYFWKCCTVERRR